MFKLERNALKSLICKCMYTKFSNISYFQWPEEILRINQHHKKGKTESALQTNLLLLESSYITLYWRMVQLKKKLSRKILISLLLSDYCDFKKNSVILRWREGQSREREDDIGRQTDWEVDLRDAKMIRWGLSAGVRLSFVPVHWVCDTTC